MMRGMQGKARLLCRCSGGLLSLRDVIATDDNSTCMHAIQREVRCARAHSKMRIISLTNFWSCVFTHIEMETGVV